MEIKKSKKADLEGTRASSLLIGYIFALALIFACFEWTTREYAETEPVVYAAYAPMEEEIIPITQPVMTAAPPPPADTPPVAEILDIVDNDTDIKEEEIESTEDTNEATANYTGLTSPVAAGPVVAGPVGPVQEEEDENEVFQVVEQMPEFPGGYDALNAYLTKNIKYPAFAQENNIQGRVLVEFVVNKDGSVVDAKVVKSVDSSVDKEALRVVSAMPRWTPGKQHGKPVRCKYTVPVMFRLQ
ncbi:MAG: energy transducer TonB [Prevotellaceae bacterium]|nr:energy transducer TonB [Prevotellaceae bacterium]